MRRWLAIGGVVALLVGGIGLWVAAAWVGDLEERVEARFRGRLFAVPSRVYSGSLVLYPGMDIERVGLLERLHRLNYHQAGSDRAAPGEYIIGEESVEIMRRPFAYPHRVEPGGLARLYLDSSARISEIHDAEGRVQPTVEIEPELIAKLRGDLRQDRRLVSLDSVSPMLVDAVIAIEDQAFFTHGGLHLHRIAGAFLANLRAGRVVQGGSTLTQQLVKNFYLTREQTLSRKLTEAVMALLLERNHDKREILEAYLNEVYVGQRGSVSIHGMGEAAYYYLAKDADDLTLADAALLAGIIKGPGMYSPQRQPQRTLRRRNLVLGVMLSTGKINQQQHDEAVAQPLGVQDFPKRGSPAPHFVEYLRQDLAEVYGDEILRSEGMSIYTTLDPHLQRAANRALVDGLVALEARLPAAPPAALPDTPVPPDGTPAPVEGAIVVLAPRTGEVLAMVGGRDFSRSQFNRATQARRQPGSVFKPIVALAALARSDGAPAFTLASKIDDAPLRLALPVGEWTPENYDGEYRGAVTLRRALEESLNVPMARVGIEVGPERIIRTARLMGIESPLEPLPSLSLGAFELTLLEAARSYAVLAAGGLVPVLRGYTEVVHSDGRVLQRQDRDFERAFDPAEIYLVTSALHGAVDHGTGRALRRRGFEVPLAGKTGTSSNFRDAWFIGFTPDLVVAVWVGFDDGRSLGMPGSVAALPIFADVLEAAQGKTGGAEFLTPSGVERVSIDPETGLRAGTGCPGEDEVFLSGTAPTGYCGARPAPLDRMLDWIRRKL